MNQSQTDDLVAQAQNKIDQWRNEHRRTMGRATIAPSDTGAQEEIALMLAHISVIIVYLFSDRLLWMPPYRIPTEQIRARLQREGTSEHRSFLTYEEMAAIASFSMMVPPDDDASSSGEVSSRDQAIEEVRLMLLEAFQHAEVNAGYLESKGFYSETQSTE